MEYLAMKKFVLAELSKMDLNGMFVTDFSIDTTTIKLVVKLGDSLVAFLMKDHDFEVLSAIHHGKKYEDEAYLKQFFPFVEAAIAYLSPIVREKMEAYTQMTNTIEYREKQIKIREEQVQKRKLTLDAREKLLKFQTEAVDFEHQTLEADKLRGEVHGVRKWGRENDFLIKWLVAAIVVLLVIVAVMLIS